MTTRERFLAIGVLGFISLAGVALMVSQFIITPLRDRSRKIGQLKDDVAEKNARIYQILADKPKLELWRKQSLPADVGLARLEYEKYLREQFRLSGFEGSSYSVTPGKLDNRTATPGKKDQPFTPLTFAVEVTSCELPDLVDFLERFYRTPLMHQIKIMNISRVLTPQVNVGGPPAPFGQQKPKNELKVKMNIEALVLHEADTRNKLLPGVDRQLAAADVLATLCNAPSGFALMPWAIGPTGPGGSHILAEPAREYASIAGKDIFYGPPPIQEQITESYDSLEHVFLTDITYGTRWEAFLYARNNNTKTRLRASAGFDTFRIRDSKGETLIQGKILRIEDRDVIFTSGDKYYSIHVGQNLDETLKHPLDASKLKELGLATGNSQSAAK